MGCDSFMAGSVVLGSDCDWSQFVNVEPEVGNAQLSRNVSLQPRMNANERE
jgi:hypothetical protein